MDISIASSATCGAAALPPLHRLAASIVASKPPTHPHITHTPTCSSGPSSLVCLYSRSPSARDRFRLPFTRPSATKPPACGKWRGKRRGVRKRRLRLPFTRPSATNSPACLRSIAVSAQGKLVRRRGQCAHPPAHPPVPTHPNPDLYLLPTFRMRAHSSLPTPPPTVPSHTGTRRTPNHTPTPNPTSPCSTPAHLHDACILFCVHGLVVLRHRHRPVASKMSSNESLNSISTVSNSRSRGLTHRPASRPPPPNSSRQSPPHRPHHITTAPSCTHLPPRDSTQRESPALATHSSPLRTSAVTAVHPAEGPK